MTLPARLRSLKVRRVAAVAVIGCLPVAACGSPGTGPTDTRIARVTTIATAAPTGFDVSGAEWFLIRGAGGKPSNVQVAAVLRPDSRGPFPVVVYLHGSGGLARWMVQWSARLAGAGFVVVAGCWNFVSTEPNLPVMPCPKNLAPGEDAIAALIEASRTLSGVNRDMVGLFGISATSCRSSAARCSARVDTSRGPVAPGGADR